MSEIQNNMDSLLKQVYGPMVKWQLEQFKGWYEIYDLELTGWQRFCNKYLSLIKKYPTRGTRKKLIKYVTTEDGNVRFMCKPTDPISE